MRLEQPLKADSETVSTPDKPDKSVRDVQFAKHSMPTLVTVVADLTDFRLEHPLNVYGPNDVISRAEVDSTPVRYVFADFAAVPNTG